MQVGIAEAHGRRFLAARTRDGLVDLSKADDGSAASRAARHAQGLEEVLAVGEEALRWLELAPTSAPKVAGEVRWRSPVRMPSKICGIGLNYVDHCKEQGIEPPKSPVLFAKFTTAIIGPGDEIRWDPSLSDKIDWEAELAVVIGKKARNVPKAKAFEHVLGYVCANDVTARDIQKGDGQFVRGKSLDTFCPLGPYVVTRDEVHAPEALRIQCRVNGVTKQDSNTKNLIFGVAELIAFLSRAFTLLPGDVILTGTPPGVGMHRKPPEYLRDGDQVEVELEGLGVLRNPCRAAS